MTAAVAASGLTRRYDEVTAVDQISFSIPANQVVGLLGHNGAGKSTVIKMIAGYLEPSAGELLIHGVDACSGSQKLQRELGYLPENLPLYPEMLVADYLDYVATLKGIAKAERFTNISQALAATDLNDRALDSIACLSRGLRQRVGVAQAILGQPSLLVLDEPSSGLDPQQAEQMRELILRLSRRATIILSTHIIPDINAVCDRVLALRNGQIALDCLLSDLQHEEFLLLRAAPCEPLSAMLAKLPQVKTVNQLDEEQYRLQLHPGTDCDRAAGNVAQCVVQCGSRIFELQAHCDDLESLYQTLADTQDD